MSAHAVSVLPRSSLGLAGAGKLCTLGTNCLSVLAGYCSLPT